MERRCKGGKERSIKPQRCSKSLQTNNSHNLEDGVGNNKTSGKDKSHISFLSHGSYNMDSYSPSVNEGAKQGRPSPVSSGANSSLEVQALTKEVLWLFLTQPTCFKLFVSLAHFKMGKW